MVLLAQRPPWKTNSHEWCTHYRAFRCKNPPRLDSILSFFSEALCSYSMRLRILLSTKSGRICLKKSAFLPRKHFHISGVQISPILQIRPHVQDDFWREWRYRQRLLCCVYEWTLSQTSARFWYYLHRCCHNHIFASKSQISPKVGEHLLLWMTCGPRNGKYDQFWDSRDSFYMTIFIHPDF